MYGQSRTKEWREDGCLGKKKKIGCGEAACPWMAKRSRRTAQISISRLFFDQCRATHRTTLTGNREARHDSAIVLFKVILLCPLYPPGSDYEPTARAFRRRFS
jgi:hypothetical protein